MMTVLPASILFIIVTILISIEGGQIVERRSIKFAQQVLSTTAEDIQSIISGTENTGESIAMAFEEYYNCGKIIDTASCFRLLERTINSNPSIFGCGFYFAPRKYDRQNDRIGIYANRQDGQEDLLHEWDTDASTAEDGWDYFEQEFYVQARESDTTIWLSPYLEIMFNDDYHLLTTYVYPMKDSKGEFIGVFAIDLFLDWIHDKLVLARPYGNSNVVLSDEEFNVICNPLSPKPYEGTMYESGIIPGSGSPLESGVTAGMIENLIAEGSLLKIGKGSDAAFLVFDKMPNGWVLCIASLYKDVFADLIKLWIGLTVLAAITLLLLFFISRRNSRKISRPISEFADAAGKITDGRFDVPIPEVNTGDELTDLGKALTYMQQSVTDYIVRLKSTTAEKERLKSELDVARNIQGQMLCKDFPTLSGGGIYATSIPAREVGGDLYDFFVDGSGIYFIVGDVSGKGVPAALLMSITIAAFRAISKSGHSMAEIASLINNTFCRSNEDMMFVTMVIGKIDVATGNMQFCNAGHNPMMIISPDGKASYVKARNNLACGIMEGFEYVGEELSLQKGSRLIVYSDGITEAEAADKSQYGEPRLIEWGEGCMASTDDRKAVDSLIESVKAFTDGNEQNDDMTVLSISL